MCGRLLVYMALGFHAVGGIVARHAHAGHSVCRVRFESPLISELIVSITVRAYSLSE